MLVYQLITNISSGVDATAGGVGATFGGVSATRIDSSVKLYIINLYSLVYFIILVVNLKLIICLLLIMTN